jgi:hypothetical protein
MGVLENVTVIPSSVYPGSAIYIISSLASNLFITVTVMALQYYIISP